MKDTDATNTPVILAVDFDGTVCSNRYPEIGEPDDKLIAALVSARERGAYLILWTCRKREALVEAICWCAERGLHFDAVNRNHPTLIQEWGDTTKVFAHKYLDDRACGWNPAEAIQYLESLA